MSVRRLADRLQVTLIGALAAALDPAERTVVLGDLAESKASPACALREITGLVARRQLAVWAEPGPWIALLAISLPVGVLLSHVTRWWSDASAIYIRLYVERFSWVYMRNPGSRQEMTELAVGCALGTAALFAWSWTAGFSLATLSRRALWLTGGLFALALFAGTLGSTTTARAGFHGVVATHFYGLVLPRLFRVGLVLLPALLGARAAARRGRVLLPVALAGAGVLLLAVWGAPRVEGAVSYGRNTPWAGPGPDGSRGTGDDPRPISLRLIPLGVAWPAAFAVALTLRRTHKKDGITH